VRHQVGERHLQLDRAILGLRAQAHPQIGHAVARVAGFELAIPTRKREHLNRTVTNTC
jgi:hypothetical protein